MNNQMLKGDNSVISGYIRNRNDLYADQRPSLLSHFLIQKFGYMLDPNDTREYSHRIIRRKQLIHPIMMLLVPGFMKVKMKVEKKGRAINGPAIYISNHRFKDDCSCSILAARRHVYILFGSIPVFYNTFDGFSAWLNGCILVNRKVKESRKSCSEKCIKVLKNGGSILIFPEGVWNKTPNKPLLDLWPGIYRIAKAAKVKIVPIVHYIEDETELSKNNVVHTVVGNPVDIINMPEEDALIFLRDRMVSILWRLFEKYGKADRKELINGFKNSKEAWEHRLKDRCKPIKYYDKEIELTADYRPEHKKRAYDVYKNIAEIKNITDKNDVR